MTSGQDNLFYSIKSRFLLRTFTFETKTGLQTMLLLVTSVLPLMFFVFLHFLTEAKSTWRPSEYQHSGFLNLTNTEIIWDYHFGKSPYCGTLDCHLSKNYPSDRFMVHTKLPDSKSTSALLSSVEKPQILARTKVDLSKFILTSPPPLGIQFQHNTERYEFYVNDFLVGQGSSSLATIKLPDQLLSPPPTSLAIKLFPRDDSQTGFSDQSNIVIGPWEKLLELKTRFSAISDSVKTIFLYVRILLLLVLLLLFTKNLSLSQASLLLCNLFFILRLIFSSPTCLGYFTAFPLAWVLSSISNNIAQILLFLFLCDFFLVSRNQINTLYNKISLAALVLVILIPLLLSGVDSLKLLEKFAVLFRFFTLSCGSGLFFIKLVDKFEAQINPSQVVIKNWIFLVGLSYLLTSLTLLFIGWNSSNLSWLGTYLVETMLQIFFVSLLISEYYSVQKANNSE